MSESSESRHQSHVVADAVRSLFRAVATLEALYPERRFTLDGHLVGSLGEAIAAEVYRLRLLPASAPTHDAMSPAGTPVQIKLTGGKRIALYSRPQHLIVLRWEPSGAIEEVYNGPGDRVWEHVGPKQKNGQHSISVHRLRRVADGVDPGMRLARHGSWPAFGDHLEATKAGHSS